MTIVVSIYYLTVFYYMFTFGKISMQNVDTWQITHSHLIVCNPLQADCRACQKVIYPGSEVLCSVRSCDGAYHLTCAKERLGLTSSKKFKCPQHVKLFHLSSFFIFGYWNVAIFDALISLYLMYKSDSILICT